MDWPMKLALLHALPLDERMWEPELAALAGHEVQAPNLYGLGSSMDEWALGVLQQVPGKLVAVGASMGGYCASAIARLVPERLEGLVLVGSRADADPPERTPLRDEWIRIAREQGAEGLWEATGSRFFGPNADPAVVSRARQIAIEQDGEDLARAVAAIRDRPDSTEAVTSGIPLLVVAGEDDVLIPAEVGRELAAASPNGRAEILAGCGHLPSMERSDEFNRILTTFLESL
jgi:pimeloyl-ACP methyl ester carboxylesterase